MSHETELCNHTEFCVSYVLILLFFSYVFESWRLSSGRSFSSIKSVQHSWGSELCQI